MDKAYLNNIELDMETIEDSFSKAIVRREYPYKDMPDLHDMGLKTRVIKIRCYFLNDRYAVHFSFKDMLYDIQAFTLQHPVYGSLNGTVENVNIRHDDRQKTAEIDFDFLVGKTDFEPVAYTVVDSEAESIYEAGLTESSEEFSASIVKSLGSEASNIIGVDLDPNLGILEQFSGLSTVARDYVKRVDAVVSEYDAILQEVTTPASALISTIDFAVNLPGRVIGTIAKTVNRYSQLYESIKTGPERFLNSIKDGFQELENAFPKSSKEISSANIYNVDTHLWVAVKSVCALESGLQAGEIYGKDEETRQMRKKMESISSFDREGKYLKSGITLAPVMNVLEIEKTLSAVRTTIQEAVDVSRPAINLKKMARLLLSHVNEIKLEREKIISVTLDNEMPLHLACLKYGLPYQAAERVLSINPGIKNPNFTPRSIDIYER